MSEYYKNCYELAEQLDKLKTELEQEKALKETYLTCYKAKHDDINGELFKLKQTLLEIKEVKYDVYTTRADLRFKLDLIKNKISECEINYEN